MSRVDPILALLLSPFVASMILLLGLAIYVVSRIDRKRVMRNRARESELTLAYIADVQRLEQATSVETARLRAGESA